MSACAVAAPLPAAAQEAGEGQQAASLRQQAIAYEHGESVGKDAAMAVILYCEAARLGDAQAQFNLGWMYANGRGVARDDATAAYLVKAAAEQGVVQAQRLLEHLGTPSSEPPVCLRPPPPAASQEQETAPLPPVKLVTSAPRPIAKLVERIAVEYQVHPQLVLLIMQAESGFDAQAVSAKNAQGLMQLIPRTAARFNVEKPFDPEQNIRGGLAYLRWLLAYFEGDLALVAAAYNAGEGTVDRYLGVPPYGETRRYVRRILDGFGRTVHPFDAKVTKPSARLERIRALLATR